MTEDRVSTHPIGTVRLLLGSLVLMLTGAGAFWMLGGTAPPAALVIRGGALEIEPWSGTLRPQGADLYWDGDVSVVAVSRYKAEDADQEFDLGEPVVSSGVHTIRIDLRVDGSRLVERALVATIEDRGVKIAVNNAGLAKRGDVWVHPGFVQGGQRKPFEIAVLELLGADGQVVARHQNPDMGRRFRYRIKLSGTSH